MSTTGTSFPTPYDYCQSCCDCSCHQAYYDPGACVSSPCSRHCPYCNPRATASQTAKLLVGLHTEVGLFLLLTPMLNIDFHVLFRCAYATGDILTHVLYQPLCVSIYCDWKRGRFFSREGE